MRKSEIIVGEKYLVRIWLKPVSRGTSVIPDAITKSINCKRGRGFPGCWVHSVMEAVEHKGQRVLMRRLIKKAVSRDSETLKVSWEDSVETLPIIPSNIVRKE